MPAKFVEPPAVPVFLQEQIRIPTRPVIRLALCVQLHPANHVDVQLDHPRRRSAASGESRRRSAESRRRLYSEESNERRRTSPNVGASSQHNDNASEPEWSGAFAFDETAKAARPSPSK